MIGRASFDEIARGQISGALDGMLKLVADVDGKKLLGVMIVGEGATELVHIGQMALIHGAEIDVFVENVFNFPTFAEAFREAALDIIWQRSIKMDDQASGSKYSSDCAGKLVTSE
jgi:NAD(P) transhydrogenase